MIAGQPRTVLVRGIGPTLARYGVDTPLADPKLEVYKGQVKIAENDDWNSLDSARFIQAGAFPLDQGSKDSALAIELQPGGYTAILSGVNGTTGIGLIEVYALPGVDVPTAVWQDEFIQQTGTGPDPAK